MFDYYQPPKQAIFEDIKAQAIKIWQKYDNTYGYVDEKVNRIKDLANVQDNAWHIVAMFDCDNQVKLLKRVNAETEAAIREMFDCMGAVQPEHAASVLKIMGLKN